MIKHVYILVDYTRSIYNTNRSCLYIPVLWTCVGLNRIYIVNVHWFVSGCVFTVCGVDQFYTSYIHCDCIMIYLFHLVKEWLLSFLIYTWFQQIYDFSSLTSCTILQLNISFQKVFYLGSRPLSSVYECCGMCIYGETSLPFL